MNRNKKRRGWCYTSSNKEEGLKTKVSRATVSKKKDPTRYEKRYARHLRETEPMVPITRRHEQRLNQK
jgi:hypothetical protein